MWRETQKGIKYLQECLELTILHQTEKKKNCIKLYHNVVFMVSFRGEKGPSLTGMYMYFLIN